jgi:hypothetical protein
VQTADSKKKKKARVSDERRKKVSIPGFNQVLVEAEGVLCSFCHEF